jgi:putative nucleotidyltransferase with HDIG domain
MSTSVLIRPPKSVPAATPATTRQTLLDNLDRLEDYPMLSETTIWAMAMVNNPNASMAEVANLIRRDAVIASAVLRRANNWAVYGTKRVIENIQQAVVRVGLQECGKMLCTMGMRALSDAHPKEVQEQCDEVHRHSLFVAQMAGEINRTAGLGFSGGEFTAGLLHDIGRVILLVKCPPGESGRAPTSLQGEDILDIERARFGIDHCALGYQFAQKNNLPEHLTRAILNHHRPGEELFQPELVALIAMANQLANHVQRHHNITDYKLEKCPIFEVMANRWSGQREEAFARSLPGIVVRAIKSTRVMLKSFA